MDFGVNLDGLGFLGSSDNGFSGLGLSSEVETRPRGLGSGCLKQGRSGLMEDEWRNQQGSLKMAKIEDFSVSKAMLLQQKPTLLRSNSLFPDGQLSFSAAKSEVGLITNDGFERSLQSATLPCYHQSGYARSSGLGSGSMNSNMHGGLAGIRGPFTPSQWLELEHQALIFKYLTANVPVPVNLIIPIRKSLNPTAFSGFSAGSLRHYPLGWGSLHMGFSGNPDPEPGRCRRTDGKKWRCSRDAVADQKYCERHMNRGRHRSRKPVEGQTGHAAAKALPPVSSSPATVSGGGGTDNLAIAEQIKSLQPASDPSATNFSRFLINKQNIEARMRDSHCLSMLPSINLKPKDPQFPIPKTHLSFEEQPPQTELESLLNPQKNSYFQTKNFTTSASNLNARELSRAQSLRHFIDDWPKTRPDRPTISWPDIEEIQTDRTQLSISIPVASSDFSSSSSPPQEKITLSPLKLSCELDPIQMGLGVGALNEASQRPNWIPISWETSMGGPLAEVLNSTNTTPKDCSKNSTTSALNLMTEGWDASPRLVSSPTGVLQKTTFGSLSNSSTGSSPRAENSNKVHENYSHCDDLLG